MRTAPTALWLLLALTLAAAAPGAAQTREGGSEELSFYGLRFGMTPEQVKAVAPTNPAASEVIEPGHGMLLLSLVYDYRNRLVEIRAAYERPADRLREAALRQALRERFLQPIPTRWRSISAEVDEVANRAALTLVLVAQDLRQEALEHFKAEYLKQLE